MSEPEKGYWEGMPPRIKVLAPLTAVMIIIGGAMMFAGFENGIILVGTPILIIVLRLFWLFFWEDGPQSILGYTYTYLTGRVETAYSMPKGILTPIFLLVFFIVVILGITFGR